MSTANSTMAGRPKSSVDICVKAAGLLIFRRCHQEVQYLLLQKSFKKHEWSPPKGHVDRGESTYDAALRETKEETNLLPEHLDIYKDISWTLRYETKRNIPKEVVYWLAQMKDSDTPVTLSQEHKSYRWLGLAKASAISQWVDLQGMLTEAEKHLSQKDSQQQKNF